MKHVIILSILVLSSTALIAQEASSIIVLSCSGQANYSSIDGGEEVALVPGLDLPVSGSIFVNSEARVRIIVNQKSVILSGPGRYKLSEIFDANTKKSMSFSSRFWRFVVSGMGDTKDSKDLIKYHREFMQSHGGIKGFAGLDSSIILSPLIRENISVDEVVFSWTTPNYNGACDMKILDSQRQQVYSYLITERSHPVNLNDLGLSFGGKYTWVINYKSGGKIHSSELEFQFVPHKQSSIIEKLLYLEDYINADPKEKKWMKAVMLEMEGYFYEADATFRHLLSEDPTNMFVQKSYALFLCRQNKLNDAGNVLVN